MIEYLKRRPVVRKASETHYQIRRLIEPASSGHGSYLVWPDGPPSERTRPLATSYTLSRAVQLARRGLLF